MSPSTTSAQFGLFRILFGTYLLSFFMDLYPHHVELLSGDGLLQNGVPLSSRNMGFFALLDTALMTHLTVGAALLGALLFTLGFMRRWMAFLLWVIWLSVLNQNPLLLDEGSHFVGLLLLLSAVIPNGEQLAVTPSREDWIMPPAATRGALFILMSTYSVSGYLHLHNPDFLDGTQLLSLVTSPLFRWPELVPSLSAVSQPSFELLALTYSGLELLALPLIIIPFTRKWIWLGWLCLQAGFALLFDASNIFLGIGLFHLFTFNHHWLPSVPQKKEKRVVFFDGLCGLCNGAVDFILSEDPGGRYRFAPTQGETAQTLGHPDVISGKSMALLEGDQLYTRSDAVLRIAAGLGGVWRILSWARWIPRPLRNLLYELVQRNRYRVFGKRETCRMPTKDEKARFLP